MTTIPEFVTHELHQGFAVGMSRQGVIWHEITLRVLLMSDSNEARFFAGLFSAIHSGDGQGGRDGVFRARQPPIGQHMHAVHDI